MKHRILILFSAIAAVSSLSACDVGSVLSTDNTGGSSVTESTSEEPLHEHSLVHVGKVTETCYEDGNIEYWYCTECGKYFSDAEAMHEISRENTVIRASHILEHVEYKSATCYEDGNIEYWHCEECGRYFSDSNGTDEIDSDCIVLYSGHTYGDDDICEVCGMHRPTSGLSYEYDSKTDSYVLSGIGEATDTDLYIADVYDNGLKGKHPVTSIGSKAFYKNTDITSVHIPNSVTTISDRAFSGCTALKSADIPDSVTFMDDFVFYNCNSLESIILPDGITEIPESAFMNCYSLTSVYIPEGVTTIDSWAFKGCTSLPSVDLPDSITEIGDWAFRECVFTTMELPSSLTTLGSEAFVKCYSLESITIPAGVTFIGYRAFCDCESLTSVTFEATDGWYVSANFYATSGTILDLTDPAANAVYISDTYTTYYWFRTA